MVTLVTGTAVTLEVAEGDAVVLVPRTDPANDLCRGQAAGIGEMVSVTPAVALVSGTATANHLFCRNIGAGQAAGIGEIVSVTLVPDTAVAEANGVYWVYMVFVWCACWCVYDVCMVCVCINRMCGVCAAVDLIPRTLNASVT